MPVVIKELNINATVTEDAKKSVEEVDVTELKEKILAECVEAVLKILEDKKKR